MQTSARPFLDNLMQKSWHDKLAFFFVFLLAISCQIALHIELSTEHHIRLQASDFVIPLAGIFVLYSLISRKSTWPIFKSKWPLILIVATTAIYMLSFMKGYASIGSISSWALYNRLLGWFLLMSYLAFFAWIQTNFGNRCLKLFISALIGFFFLYVFYDTTKYLYNIFNPHVPHFTEISQYAGFMLNRNAFALIYLFCFAFMQIYMKHKNPDKLIKFFHIFLWLILPLFIIYNGSRSGIIALLIILPLSLFLSSRVIVLRSITYLVIGSIFAFIVFKAGSNTQHMWVPERFDFLVQTFQYSAEETPKDYIVTDWGEKRIFPDKSETVRRLIYKDALELWQTSPILGIGMGAFLDQQTLINDAGIKTPIDSSILWILVELGLIGFVVFGFFYISLLYISFNNGFNQKKYDIETDFHQTAFLFLIGLGILSLLNDINQTRFIWILAGFLMAEKYKNPSHSST